MLNKSEIKMDVDNGRHRGVVRELTARVALVALGMEDQHVTAPLCEASVLRAAVHALEAASVLESLAGGAYSSKHYADAISAALGLMTESSKLLLQQQKELSVPIG